LAFPVGITPVVQATANYDGACAAVNAISVTNTGFTARYAAASAPGADIPFGWSAEI
jgi:hypothetical protein